MFPSFLSKPARSVLAVIVIAALGGMTTSVQPMILGALENENRISEFQIGIISTTEMLAMALVNAVFAWKFHADRPRLMALCAAALVAVGNFTSLFVPGDILPLMRLLSGSGTGLIMCVLLATIVKQANPTRLAAFYLIAQTSFALFFSSVVRALLPIFGGNGGYGLLMVAGLISILLAFLIPKRAADDTQEAIPVRASAGPGRAIAGLGGAMLFVSAVAASWVYALPLARSHDISADVANFAIVIALGGQVAAAIVVSTFAHALRPTVAIIGGIVIGMAVMAGLIFASADYLFTGLFASIGFIWMFVLPFIVPHLMSVDPSGRYVLMVPPAQQLGGAIGPFFGSMAVLSIGSNGPLFASIALFVASGLMILASRAVRTKESEAELRVGY